MDAAEKTFRDHLIRVVLVTNFCKQEFEKLGTKIYTPTDDEKAQWIEQCGHTRPEWNAIKMEILGDPDIFFKLLAATKINNGYTYR